MVLRTSHYLSLEMDRMRKENLALYVGLFVWTSSLIHPLKSDSPCESVLFSFIVYTRSVQWRRGRFCYLGSLQEQTDRHTCGTHVHHVRICPVRPRADKLFVRESPAAFARQQGCNKKGSISHSFIDGCHLDTPVRRLQFRRGVCTAPVILQLAVNHRKWASASDVLTTIVTRHTKVLSIEPLWEGHRCY